MIFLNIRSWNGHMKHLLSDNTFECCDLMCFTETHMDDTGG